MAAPSYNTPPVFGRNAHLFQPPQSPASPGNTTSTDYFSTQSRKRQRPDSSHSYDRPQQTPWTATPSWVQCPTPSDGVYSSAQVNERYRLADGFDTPGLMATSDFQSDREQLEFRTRVRDSNTSTQQRYEPISGPLARERNGVPRLPSSSNGDSSTQAHNWASFAFTLVSKAFSFGSGMIRGFYAGEGPGYDFQTQHQPSPSRGWIRPRSSIDGASTPVPGSWRDEEMDGNGDYFLGDFEQDNPHSPTASTMTAERPANKRRQTDKDTWIMVGTPPAEISEAGSPKRKSFNPGIARNNPVPNRASASRASSRRSLAPISRRQQTTHTTHTGSPAAQQHSPDRRASLAPTRSQRPSLSNNSPVHYVSPDAERYVKRQARQDRATDKAMSSMSKQLEDLIRQGQQALGTKFSVEGHADGYGGEETDEGFVDEEW